MNTQQHGYTPRYYIANQSPVPVPVRGRSGSISGPMSYIMPMSMPSSMPIPMRRYTNGFPYQHPEGGQHASYISYNPYPLGCPPVSYNPYHRYVSYNDTVY
jgi:hypothetical protein